VYKLKNNYLSHRGNKLFGELKRSTRRISSETPKEKPRGGKNNGKFPREYVGGMITKILYSASSKKIIFHRKKNANGSRKYVLGEKAKEFFFRQGNCI
jgi:hypothetical protein